MTEVFADTFYFVALANADDKAHSAAVTASKDRSRTLVTTAWVLTEVANALAQAAHRSKFARLLLTRLSRPTAPDISLSAVLTDPTGISTFNACSSSHPSRISRSGPALPSRGMPERDSEEYRYLSLTT